MPLFLEIIFCFQYGETELIDFIAGVDGGFSLNKFMICLTKSMCLVGIGKIATPLDAHL